MRASVCPSVVASRSLRTQCIVNLLDEFHQIYNLLTFGDKDEVITSENQKRSKSKGQEQTNYWEKGGG